MKTPRVSRLVNAPAIGQRKGRMGQLDRACVDDRNTKAAMQDRCTTNPTHPWIVRLADTLTDKLSDWLTVVIRLLFSCLPPLTILLHFRKLFVCGQLYLVDTLKMALGCLPRLWLLVGILVAEHRAIFFTNRHDSLCALCSQS